MRVPTDIDLTSVACPTMPPQQTGTEIFGQGAFGQSAFGQRSGDRTSDIAQQLRLLFSKSSFGQPAFGQPFGQSIFGHRTTIRFVIIKSSFGVIPGLLLHFLRQHHPQRGRSACFYQLAQVSSLCSQIRRDSLLNLPGQPLN